MRILLDHCVPRPLKRLLPGHDVKHTRDVGWADLENGALIATAARAGFDAMITVDKNVRHQHALDRLPMSLVELNTILATAEMLATLAPYFDSALAATATHRFVSVAADGTLELLAPRGPR